MKNIVKSGIAAGAVAYANVASAIDFGGGNVDAGIRGTADSADVAIQTLLTNFFRFLYLIAVLYAIWGGFNILTAGGDEEKVKKGKTILIQAILGLVVIFLASSIIEWVVGALFA